MARDTRVHSAQPILAEKLGALCEHGDMALAVVIGELASRPHASTVAASAAINTTETVITPSFLIKANTMQPGSKYRVKIHGTCTSTNADVNTFSIQLGAAGTEADQLIATVAATSAGSGTTVPFMLDFDFVCRTSTTGAAFGVLYNNGVTGFAAAAITVGATGTATISTILDRYLSVSYLAAAVTTTVTIQLATVEVVVA